MPAVRAPAKDAAIRKLGLNGAAVERALRVTAIRGRSGETEADAVIALAAAGGVRLIAAGAPHGAAETALARLVARPSLAGAAPFRILVKTLPIAAGLVQVEVAARSSLARLGVSEGAAIVVQAAGDLLGAEGDKLWTLLRRLKDEGLYEAVGVAVRPGDDPAALARRFKPDLVHASISLLDQRLIADGSLAALADMGVETHLRSVFQQGLLFLPRSGLPANLADAGPRLSRIQRTIAEAGADPLRAALSFALNRPEASAVIVGVASAAELRAVLAAAGAPALDLDWSALGLDNPRLLDPVRAAA